MTGSDAIQSSEQLFLQERYEVLLSLSLGYSCLDITQSSLPIHEAFAISICYFLGLSLNLLKGIVERAVGQSTLNI